MNAILNIQVRVAAREAAQEIASLKKQIQALQSSGGSLGGSGFGSGVDKFFGKLQGWNGKLESFGKNLQWTGRQLEYAFTLPILAAAAAATKWELANETAATQLRKVYGLVGNSVQDVNSDLKILDTTVSLLSQRFGVQKAQVYDVAKAWAEAGLSGVGLQRAVQNSLEASAVGSIDLTTATNGLIAVQAAYKLSTVQMRTELANLDLIQVQSGVSFAGLLDVMSRAGATAQAVGVDIRHLAAWAASITPAAGTAAQAGNALRTIFSRLAAPTKDAADLMALMGIDVDKAGWSTLNGNQRLELLVKTISKLPDSKKLIVDTFVAGRFQLNRFSALVDDAAKSNGFYQRSLANTADEAKALQTYQGQLNTVLDSAPQRLKILGVTLQNSLADIIQPMLPTLLGLVYRIVDLVQAFTHLSPQMQQFILMGIGLLAITGPIVRYLGAWSLLIAQIGKVAIRAGEAVGWFIGKMIESANTGLLGKGFDFIAKQMHNLAGVADKVWTWIVGAQTTAEATQIAEANATAADTAAAITAGNTEAASSYALLPAAAGSAGGATVAYWVVSSAGVVTAVTLANAIAATSEGLIPIGAGVAAGVTLAIWTAASTAVVGVVGGAAVLAGEEMLALPAAAAAGAAAAGSGVIAAILGWLAELGAAFAGLWGWFVTIFAGIFDTFGGVIATSATVGEAVAGVVAEVAAGVGGAVALILSLPVDIIAALVAIAAAVVALVIVFRHQITDAIEWVIRGFAALPGALANSLAGTLRVVQVAVQDIVGWLSYLNPFARHSPSLVDYVNAGTAEISARYRWLAQEISASLAAAKVSAQGFGMATAGTQDAFDRAEYQKKRDTIVKYIPSAAPATDNLINNIIALKGVLRDLDPEITAQEVVVTKWAAALEAAKVKTQNAENLLTGLRDAASATKDALDAAQQKLTDYANTPIQGMRAMEDQIFANDQAQKQLQLDLLKMEDTYGTFDKIKSKLAAIQGQVEMLRGEQTSLRQAGAGSDILKAYQDQIDALQGQGDGMQAQADQMQALQDQIAALAHQGQELDLTKSLNFDGLQRQIDQASKSMTEMPFDQIIAGIKDQQTQVASLTTLWDQQEAAVKAQEGVVHDYQAGRDALQQVYDNESAKLDALKQSYSDVTDQVNKMESALTSMSSAIDSANQAAKESQAVKEFNAPAADFPDVGGNTVLGDEASNKAAMDQFNKDMQDQIKAAGKEFAGLDPFKPLKDKWHEFIKWLDGIGNDIAAPFVRAWHIAEGIFTPVISGTWNAIETVTGTVWSSIGSIISAVMGAVTSVISGAGDVISTVWNTLSDVTSTVWGVVSGVIQKAWDATLGPVFGFIAEQFNNYILPVLQVFGAIWAITWGLISKAIQWAWDNALSIVFIAIGGGLKVLGDAFNWLEDHVVRPVFDAIGTAISWAWTNVIYPILKAMGDFINTVLGVAFQWLYDYVIKPIWDGISAYISDVWNNRIMPVFVAMKWFIENVLAPVFTWLHDNVIKPVFGFIGDTIGAAFENVKSQLKDTANFFIRVFNTIADGITSIGDFVGVKVNIQHMPEIGSESNAAGFVPKKLAEGGVVPIARVPYGVFNQARAIVGEGNPAYPEYVIPTDPRYRRQAIDLYQGAGAAMMAAGGIAPSSVRTGGGGGLGWHNVTDLVGDVTNAIQDAAVSAIAQPFLLAADLVMNEIPNDMVKGAAKWVKNAGYDWMKGEHKHNVTHAAYNGALVKGTTMGTLVRVGDRNQDETIKPLSRDSGGDSNTYNFYGDLSFPNVKDGDDAEDFLRNLKTVS